MIQPKIINYCNYIISKCFYEQQQQNWLGGDMSHLSYPQIMITPAIEYGCQSQKLTEQRPQWNCVQKKSDTCTVCVSFTTLNIRCCQVPNLFTMTVLLTVSSVKASNDGHVAVLSFSAGVWRIDGNRGSGTGRRRPPMEKEQGSVASSANVTIPSTTSVSTGSNTTTNASSRQQAVPQISVYGGITDRQTVQVEINSQSTASPSLCS